MQTLEFAHTNSVSLSRAFYLILLNGSGWVMVPCWRVHTYL